MINQPIHNHIVENLLTTLAEQGISSQQLFQRPELGIFEDRETPTIEPTKIPSLLQAAFALTNDPTLMIGLGQKIDITNLGTFGFALMSCATLKEALKLLLRYQSIASPGLSFRSLESDTDIILRTSIEIGTPLQKRLITELAFSQIIRIAQILANPVTNQTELRFKHDDAGNLQAYKAMLSVPIKFNQKHSEFLLSKDIIECKITSSNPVAHVIFQQQCEDLLRGLNRVENFSAAIRRMLIQAGGEFPNIHHIATTLHMSESTLRRRLSNEGTNFRVICDEVRNVLARQYLAATELTIAEIASLLDYSEAVSFRRAFVRWNKMTPIAYRHHHGVPVQNG
ncbi:MAG: AraC family transcriptional regulator ligand-binding domain-containing protein [Porticoccaceae bacterium]